MKDTEMLQAIYKATDNGMKIITGYLPEAEGCDRDGAYFRAYKGQRTPSCHLIQHDGVWRIKDFGRGGRSMSPVGLDMRMNGLGFRDALKHLYREHIDPRWTGTVEVESDNELKEKHVPSQPEPDAQTLAFLNGYFRVTADGVERTQELPDRTVKVFPCAFTRMPYLFTAQDVLRVIDPQGDSSPVFRLLAMASMEPRSNRDATAELTESESKSLAAKLFAIGYLLHSYKDEFEAGVWFHNAQPDSEMPTGKTLVARWVSLFRNTFEINGRYPGMHNSRFLFDGVSRDTGMVIIDDLIPANATHHLREYVKEGITVERKMCPQTTLDYYDAPKIAVTAVRPPENIASAHDGVWLTCGFSDWFDLHHKPYTQFGRVLMDDRYTQEDWNRDANFAVDCLQFYLRCRKNMTFIIEKGGLL